jgi:hypothetical protein
VAVLSAVREGTGVEAAVAVRVRVGVGVGVKVRLGVRVAVAEAARSGWFSRRVAVEEAVDVAEAGTGVEEDVDVGDGSMNSVAVRLLVTVGGGGVKVGAEVAVSLGRGTSEPITSMVGITGAVGEGRGICVAVEIASGVRVGRAVGEGSGEKTCMTAVRP